MKNMFEYMTTMIITMLIVFTFSSIVSVGTQILNARLLHSIAIDTLQSSYYTVESDHLNTSLLKDDMFAGWKFDKVREIESVNSRRTYLVTLNYRIRVPLIGSYIDGLKIEGYAR